jgi:DNA polymerase elongation subunit (family B)
VARSHGEVALSRILLFDIETSHLKADFGHLICIGWKFLDEKRVYCPTILDHPGVDCIDDRPLLREFIRAYNTADMIVTYFGKGFDSKFLNAKVLGYGLRPLPPLPHVDLYFTVKANLALSRKSLGNVGYHLRLPTEKSPVEGRIWTKAAIGNPAAVRYCKRHCVADVRLLEEAYLKLRPYVRTHPRVNGWEPCRYCGADKLQARGYAITALKGRQQRLQCQSCSGWQQRSA